MNRIRAFCFGIIILLVASAYTHKKTGSVKSEIKVLSKQYAPINDTLFAGRQEVTNEEYKLFLKDTAMQNPAMRVLCAIDSDNWKKFADADALAKHYFSHRAFNPYPVCCISWQAANEYCKWLTKKWNKDGNNLQITFRLPTPAEWMLLLYKPDKDGLNAYCPGGYDSKEKRYWLNFSINDTAAKKALDGGYFTVRTDAYAPNHYGIFNLNGNVAEMTRNPLVCKGGSWNDSLADCSYAVEKSYVLPNAMVGFRVVAIVH